MSLDRTRPDTTLTGAEYRHHCDAYRTILRYSTTDNLKLMVPECMNELSKDLTERDRPFFEAQLDAVTDMLIERLGPAEWVPARER